MTAPPKPAADIEVLDATRDPALLTLARRLRYAVLVGEKKLSPPGADHVRRLLADELDATGTTYVAFIGGQLVGTVRINLIADGGADAYADAYGLAALGSGYEARTAIVTRLVSRAERGTAVLGKLAGAALQAVAAHKARHIAIGVEDSLIAFYESMGFARFKDGVISPSGERRTALVFDMADARHREKKTLAGWLYPKLFAPGA